MKNRKIIKCRLCKSSKLKEIINLGDMALTGVFPSKPCEMKEYPLVLVKCQGECGLVQLAHQFDRNILFGDTYGYRSGLNPSMVRHLNDIVKNIEKRIEITDDDVVLDIGSNDGTLLKSYKKGDKVGFEPLSKLHKYCKELTVWPYFWPSSALFVKAKVITSIAMFYDIQNPLEFAKSVYKALTHNGIWVFEIAHWPTTVRNISYDTICHEHACYYDLPQIKYMCKKIGFFIKEVTYNDTNGGSFCITVQKESSRT